ncbi:hypothetical protein H9I45_00880 [Polaribacter haliotis]|uniref:CopG family transcriptional regulator n=2 Tax=Polaribacter TaxID=52959 RepID=A0A7L8AGF7_9FLAO|nr:MULTISPECIES: hypothetical protein [Polaribacter]MDD7914096.1 hypothetical protein [Polaribacter sp. MSW5]QOD61024.1 hypothetical protein H9I45_00880 [Polaribacter haliotis]
MEKQNISDLINKVKSNEQNKTTQKVLPIAEKKDDVQFSFYIEKSLLKKLKQKALNNDVSIKSIIINAIENSFKAN